MARAIKYRLQFKSLNNVGCLVNVYVEGATSSADTAKTGDNVPFNVETGVTELIGTADPFTFEEDDSDNLLDFVRTKTGYISVIEQNVGDLDGMMPTSKTSHFIEAYYGSQKVFVGYLQPQVFENDWAAGPLERSFPVVSPLGLLEYFNFTPPSSPSLVTLGSLMAEVANGLNAGYTHVISPKPFNRLNATITNYFPWDGKIFSKAMCPYNSAFGPLSQSSDLYSPKTYLEFVEGICKCFGWLVHDDGTKIVFQDVGQGRTTVARQYTIANLTAFASYDSLSKSSASTWHLYMEDFNDDSRISLVRPLRKLTLKYDDTDEYLYDGMKTDRCTISSTISDIQTYEAGDKLVRIVKMTPQTSEVTAENASLTPQIYYSGNIVRFSNTCFVPMSFGKSEDDRKNISMQSGWLLGNPTNDVRIKMRPCMPMAFIEDWLLTITVKAAANFALFPDDDTDYSRLTFYITVNSGSRSYRFTYLDPGTGTPTPGGWLNFTDYQNVVKPQQNGEIIGYDTISDNMGDDNLTDVKGLLLKAYQGNGKLNDEFEIIIGIQNADIYSPGAMLLFEVSMENPNKDMEHFFYQREKEHVYNGIGIDEDTIDVTLNNYGEFRNLNSFTDSNMNMSGAFMPLYSYMLNQTLKVLRQNAKKTGDIPSATVGSIYVPQMSLYNQSGYWSVISCGMNMRDDKYMLTRIPVQQNN